MTVIMMLKMMLVMVRVMVNAHLIKILLMLRRKGSLIYRGILRRR